MITGENCEYTSDLYNHIFDLWYYKNKSFLEISEMKLPSNLSLKTIERIVYGGGKNEKGHRLEIYDLFKIKFLEFQDVRKSILWVFENQPPISRSKKTVERIIYSEVKRRKKK